MPDLIFGMDISVIKIILVFYLIIVRSYSVFKIDVWEESAGGLYGYTQGHTVMHAPDGADGLRPVKYCHVEIV